MSTAKEQAGKLLLRGSCANSLLHGLCETPQIMLPNEALLVTQLTPCTESINPGAQNCCCIVALKYDIEACPELGNFFAVGRSSPHLWQSRRELAA